MRCLAPLLPLTLAGCTSVGMGETPWVLPAGRVRGGMQATVAWRETVVVGGRSDAAPARLPSALVGDGGLRLEGGVGRGVELGLLIGAPVGSLGGLVKVQMPARLPVAVFGGGSRANASYGFYQSSNHERTAVVFGGVAVGGPPLARPPHNQRGLLPYATARLAWIDARESGYSGESDTDAYDDRFRGFSPGVAVGVTLRETVGPALEVGVQGWKGRPVPVAAFRLRL